MIRQVSTSGSMASPRSAVSDDNSSSTITLSPRSIVHSPEQHRYCLIRSNGLFTRLVPADELPPGLAAGLGYPPTESSPAGMTVLNGSPNDPFDTHALRSRIDEIVVTNRHDHARAQSQGLMQLQQQQQLAGVPGPPLGHQRYHSTSSTRGGRAAHQGGKKDKEYCDKWVHEGTCAFTQQGCRYKHQMPMDKATQRALGLNNGLPSWYKKAQAEQMAVNGGLGAAQTTAAPAAPLQAHSHSRGHRGTVVGSASYLLNPGSSVSPSSHANTTPHGPSAAGSAWGTSGHGARGRGGGTSVHSFSLDRGISLRPSGGQGHFLSAQASTSESRSPFGPIGPPQCSFTSTASIQSQSTASARDHPGQRGRRDTNSFDLLTPGWHP